MRRDSCQMELAGGVSLAWSCPGPVQPFRKAVPAACSCPCLHWVPDSTRLELLPVALGSS